MEYTTGYTSILKIHYSTTKILLNKGKHRDNKERRKGIKIERKKKEKKKGGKEGGRKKKRKETGKLKKRKQYSL